MLIGLAAGQCGHRGDVQQVFGHHFPDSSGCHCLRLGELRDICLPGQA